jgi:hypothetical protein
MDTNLRQATGGHTAPMEMRYFIGEHDGIEHPFDHHTYRAYFYWREGGVPRNRSFSIEQLKSHIADCKARGKPTHKFELALARLRRINRAV